MVFFGNILKILPLLIVLVAASKANDVTWYRTFVSEQIAPAYVTAYRTLKDKIINPLLTYNAQELTKNETNVTGVVSLAQGLTCATKELYSSLSTALNASEQLNTALENKLLGLISMVSQKENEVRQANDQLRAIEARLSDTQSKVNAAENEVNNKQSELGQADANLVNEQRKVDAARLCGGRKKRFLGFVKKVVQNVAGPVVKPIVSHIVRPVGTFILRPLPNPIRRLICKVANYEGINTAESRRGAAQGAVNAAREQLATRRQELENLRSEYTNFQGQQSQKTAQLQSLSENLAQLQARQVALASMTQDIRNVMKHLATFVSKSSVLYDELQDLVSFELLIEPLNDILTELIDNGVTTQTIAGTTQVSSTEIDSIKTTIDLLKTQLPALPLNEGVSNTC